LGHLGELAAKETEPDGSHSRRRSLVGEATVNPVTIWSGRRAERPEKAPISAATVAGSTGDWMLRYGPTEVDQ